MRGYCQQGIVDTNYTKDSPMFSRVRCVATVCPLECAEVFHGWGIGQRVRQPGADPAKVLLDQTDDLVEL